MKTIDKSRLMKRAWFLVKNQGYTMSFAMSKVWKEMKEAIKKAIDQLTISEYTGSTWTPSPEKMQVYYNSDSYKGD
jgi:hypothetical protein